MKSKTVSDALGRLVKANTIRFDRLRDVAQYHQNRAEVLIRHNPEQAVAHEERAARAMKRCEAMGMDTVRLQMARKNLEE